MKKKISFLLCLMLVLTSSLGFAGEDPAATESAIPELQKQELQVLDPWYWGGNLIGDIRFSDDGSLIWVYQELGQLYVKMMDTDGIESTIPIPLSSRRSLGASVAIGNLGNAYVDTADLRFRITPEGQFTPLPQNQPLNTRIEMRSQGQETVYRTLRNENYLEKSIRFYSNADLEDPFVGLPGSERSLPTHTIQTLDGLECRVTNVLMADYGETAEQLYVLAETLIENTYGLHILELKKPLIQDTTNFILPVTLEKSIPLQVGTTAWLGHMAVTEEYFDVLISEKAETGSATLYRFTHEGELVGSIAVDGAAMSIDSFGNQTAITTKSFNDHMDRAYLVTWPQEEDAQEETEVPTTVTSGRIKPLVRLHSRKGESLAKVEDGKLGTWKVQADETDQVDYRLKVPAKDDNVKVQASLQDVLVMQGGQARDLLIDLPNETVRIPLTQFDLSGYEDALSGDGEKRVEIQLAKNPSGQRTVKIQLLIIEQVDEKTKLVHRFNLQ